MPTGNEKVLPTTATATKTPAMVTFFTLLVESFITNSYCGRDLMVSSHAGTRLPFAVMTTVGRSPASRSVLTDNIKKQRHHTVPL